MDVALERTSSSTLDLTASRAVGAFQGAAKRACRSVSRSSGREVGRAGGPVTTKARCEWQDRRSISQTTQAPMPTLCMRKRYWALLGIRFRPCPRDRFPRSRFRQALSTSRASLVLRASGRCGASEPRRRSCSLEADGEFRSILDTSRLIIPDAWRAQQEAIARFAARVNKALLFQRSRELVHRFDGPIHLKNVRVLDLLSANTQ